MIRHTRVLILLGALFLGSVASAQTAEEVREAGEAFSRGRSALKAQSYVEAAEHFEVADHKVPSHQALQMALHCRIQAEQLEQAAVLAVLGKELYPENKAIAELAGPVLKKADEQLHKVDISCSEECSLVVGTKVIHGRAAMRRVIYLTPGSQVVTASWSESRSAKREVEAVAGAASQLSFHAPALEKPPQITPPISPNVKPIREEPKQDAPPDEGGWSPAVFWTGVGLTAVAGGLTVWSGLDTQNNPGVDAVRRECGNGGPRCEELYDDGVSRQTRTNVLIGVTAGIGALTLIVGGFATDWGEPSESTQDGREGSNAAKLTVSPWIHVGDGATLGAMGRF